VIRTVEPTQRQFDEVDAAFAFDEGVGERTLDFWQRAHRDYFDRPDADAAPDLTEQGLTR
jgi:uncharacterized protein YhfF